MAKQTKTNRLAKEKSPYLLQHATNPVEWYPWGEEAFAAAKTENKPIFLSIGYSTCHWCHVMAHESFENPEVAGLINEIFIPIKVDREERPDIDMFYMRVCQLMTGSGGWPLTIMMTPDRQPFFAGTYIQKDTRFGRTGLLDLIPRIKELWEKHNTEVLGSANQITEILYNRSQPEPGNELGIAELTLAYRQLKENFDKEHGGFGLAPKFPLPHNLLFLLRYWKRTGDTYAINMVRKTLDAMRRGGIYDHIGFGFHRYSTDPIWLAPHFEKMLYDQALIAMAYIETFQATGVESYATTAREIFEYVLRDMKSPEGGFYSAEDADSEGREGKYYLWTCDQIDSALTRDESSLLRSIFNVKTGGNFPPENGNEYSENILHLEDTLKQIAYELGMPEEALREQIEYMRKKLFTAREKRVHPHKDDKVLADWNGLMIASLARAAGVLNDERYAAAAINAVSFIYKNMFTRTGELLHRYRSGQAAISGNLDDYAFLIYGLLELYEATFDIDYLKKALALNERLIRHFWDKKDGGFFFTSDDSEDLLTRQKEIYDGAIPSGNSIAMQNLLRLASITGNMEFEGKAAGIGRAFYHQVIESPSNYTQLMCAVHFAVGPSYEVLVTGNKQSEDTFKTLQALRRVFLPTKVMVFVPPETDAEITQIAPFTASYQADKVSTKIYICIDHECRLPTMEVKKAIELLDPAGK